MPAAPSSFQRWPDAHEGCAPLVGLSRPSPSKTQAAASPGKVLEAPAPTLSEFMDSGSCVTGVPGEAQGLWGQHTALASGHTRPPSRGLPASLQCRQLRRKLPVSGGSESGGMRGWSRWQLAGRLHGGRAGGRRGRPSKAWEGLAENSAPAAPEMGGTGVLGGPAPPDSRVPPP